MSTLGLILGIVGLVGGILCPFVFPLIGLGELIFVVLAILGIVFSAIGLKRNGRGAATAGLVLSIIAVVLSLIFTFACTAGKKVTDVVTDELSTMDQGQLESVINDVLEETSEEAATEAVTETATEADTEEVTEDATEAAAEETTQAPANTAAGDAQDADIVIAYGDLDAIVDLGKKAQNFEIAEGTVARISGVFSSGISTPAIQEPDGESGYKGINLYVDGDWDKPADHTDIDVTGTFIKGNYFMEFHADPENITMK